MKKSGYIAEMAKCWSYKAQFLASILDLDFFFSLNYKKKLISVSCLPNLTDCVNIIKRELFFLPLFNSDSISSSFSWLHDRPDISVSDRWSTRRGKGNLLWAFVCWNIMLNSEITKSFTTQYSWGFKKTAPEITLKFHLESLIDAISKPIAYRIFNLLVVDSIKLASIFKIKTFMN